MRMRKKNWILLIICVNSFYGLQTLLLVDKDDPISYLAQDPFSNIIETTEYFKEEVIIEVNSTGEIRSQYYWENNGQNFCEIDFSDLETTYPLFFTKLESMEIVFYKISKHPNEDSNIRFMFNAKDQNMALAYGNWVFESLFSCFIDNFELIDCKKLESTNNPTTQYLCEYQIFFEWNKIHEEFNTSISPILKGLAETINITDSDELNFLVEKYDGNLNTRWGAIWNTEVDKISGDFSLSTIEIIHTKFISKSTKTPLSLQITYILPKIEPDFIYTAIDPSQIKIINFSLQRNTWNNNHHYEIKLNLKENQIYPDFQINFTAEFTPLKMQKYERTEVYINHYGYEGRALQIQHENGYLWNQYFNSLSSPLLNFTGQYNFRSKSNEFNIILEMTYYNQTPVLASLNTIALVLQEDYNLIYTIENIVCINDINWWNGTDMLIASHFSIYFNHTFSQDQWVDIFDPSLWIFKQSHVADSNFTVITSIEEEFQYFSNMGGYSTTKTDFRWDPLHELSQTPKKKYEAGIWKNISIDIASLFGWDSVKKNPNFDFLQIQLQIPSIENSEIISDISTSTSLFGLRYKSMKKQIKSLQFTVEHITILSETPYIVKNSNQISILQCEFTHYNHFYEDTDDITAPTGQFGWLNEDEEFFVTTNVSCIPFELSENITLLCKTTEEIYTDGWMDSIHWDGSQQVSRFFVSGTSREELSFSFLYLDIQYQSDNMEINSILHYNDTKEYWRTFFDTFQLANGQYLYKSTITDQVGNSQEISWEITIQNEYHGEISSPIIEIVDPTPLIGSKVNNSVEIFAQISDPANIFATSISFGEFPFIPKGNQMKSINTEDRFKYEWDTLKETENALVFINVQAVSFSGQHSHFEYFLKVDNLFSGLPPNISLVSPEWENNTIHHLENFQKFEVFAWDDQFPLKSVSLQIDEQEPILMTLNNSKIWSNFDDLDNKTKTHMLRMNDTFDLTLPHYGYFELTYNISQLINGSHSLSISVIDRDDPEEGDGQHTVFMDYLFYAKTDLYPTTFSPLVRGIFPNNYTNSTDFLTGKVEFEIEVFDDIGIQKISMEISIIEGFNSSNYVPLENLDITAETKQKIRTEELELKETNGEWLLYSYVLNTKRVANGLYFINISIFDEDYFQHRISVTSLIIIENPNGSGLAHIPVYQFLIPISIVGISIIILRKKKQ